MATPNFKARNEARQAAARIDLERVRLMAECGHPGTAIAKALGRSPQAIRSFCCRHGIKLRPAKKPKHGARFKLPDDLFDSFRLAAAQRGMSPTQLAALVLRTVIKDDLFAAVLDLPAKTVSLSDPRSSPRPADPPAVATCPRQPRPPVVSFLVSLGGQPELTGTMGSH
jgi:hypothetical protein